MPLRIILARPQPNIAELFWRLTSPRSMCGKLHLGPHLRLPANHAGGGKDAGRGWQDGNRITRHRSIFPSPIACRLHRRLASRLDALPLNCKSAVEQFSHVMLMSTFYCCCCHCCCNWHWCWCCYCYCCCCWWCGLVFCHNSAPLPVQRHLLWQQGSRSRHFTPCQTIFVVPIFAPSSPEKAALKHGCCCCCCCCHCWCCCDRQLLLLWIFASPCQGELRTQGEGGAGRRTRSNCGNCSSNSHKILCNQLHATNTLVHVPTAPPPSFVQWAKLHIEFEIFTAIYAYLFTSNKCVQIYNKKLDI